MQTGKAGPTWLEQNCVLMTGQAVRNCSYAYPEYWDADELGVYPGYTHPKRLPAPIANAQTNNLLLRIIALRSF